MEPLNATTTHWTLRQKIFFRFAAIFIMLSTFPALFFDGLAPDQQMEKLFYKSDDEKI